MRYEVEMKFPVSDMGRIETRLADLGAPIGEREVEVDTYFGHPARDFRQTDEALRVRRKGKSNFATYKGPKIDQTTKTRREIDLPLTDGPEAAEAWMGLFAALGFAVVGEVRKQRRKAHVPWHGRRVEVSLDEVEGLGTFVELELVVDELELEAAKRGIASLAETLGLEASERRSYLELILN